MVGDLHLAGLGARTQEAYVRAVRKLAEYYRRAPDQLNERQVREYFLYLKNEREFAPGSLRIAYNGIEFFYTHTVPRAWKTLRKLKIPKQRTLPDVLTGDETRRLIAAVETPHNRAYFWTVYSCACG